MIQPDFTQSTFQLVKINFCLEDYTFNKTSVRFRMKTPTKFLSNFETDEDIGKDMIINSPIRRRNGPGVGEFKGMLEEKQN